MKRFTPTWNRPRPLRWLRSRWRAAFHRSGTGRELAQTANSLEQVNQATEKDFLEVGRGLSVITAAVREISADMTSIAQLTSGDGAAGLTAELQSMQSGSNLLETNLEQGRATLSSIRHMERELQTSLSRFTDLLPSFRAFGTLIRVEITRLGNSADIGAMAEEVTRLTNAIQLEMERVLTASHALTQRTEVAIRSINKAADGQVRKLAGLSNALVASLSSLNEQRSRAAGVSRELAAGYQAVAASIAELVFHLQSHDITRQQVEHVVETLREQAGSGIAPQLLAIQSAQLESANRRLKSASNSIGEHLSAVAAKLEEMVRIGKNMLGTPESDGGNVFRETEASLNAILGEYRNLLEGDLAASASQLELSQTVDRIQSCIQGIQGIEIQLQRLALNLTVNASHIGSKGEPVAVLAAHLHEMAITCQHQVAAVSEVPARMKQAERNLQTSMAALTGGEDGAERGRGQVFGSDGRLQSILEHMHSSSEQAYSRLLRVETGGLRLAADLTRIRDSFSAGRQFDAEISHALGMFALATAGAPTASSLSESPPAFGAGRYTMKEERAVHRAFADAGVDGAGETAPCPVTAGRTGQDLGDNVELF